MASHESPFVRVPTQVDEGAIDLHPEGVVDADPSTEIWTRVDTGSGTERWARNVTQPTLLPVLPSGSNANGAAVLVVPGGGFQFVSMDNEGYSVAGRLAAEGIAAFVLKYRTMKTPADEAGFAARVAELFGLATPGKTGGIEAGIGPAVADARAALALIRARAAEWRIDSTRLGMLGFSAGAMTLLSTLRASAPEEFPAFAGYVYGPMLRADVAEGAPPAFMALAADDALFGSQGLQLTDAWREAGGPVELHVYAEGGHGFGLKRQGATSDLWFDQFTAWMRSRGLLNAGLS